MTTWIHRFDQPVVTAARRLRVAVKDAIDVAGVVTTLIAAPPPSCAFADFPLTCLTKPFNLAGVPALAMPVPSPGHPVAASNSSGR
jgi:hypothetical protein